ncbi:MAG: rubrerythrin [Hyphomicrobiales bacterium]|uniref:ferritin family protein n=1 Tax=Rhabdaerophilum calidifontis TaxID=2604328 RepID=UPI00123C2E7D|nr:ferritin family protein [Rhabdaerophilum calidifontis]MCA1998221.1 rubrerythrin [Hyphomicrobiales bacterium]
MSAILPFRRRSIDDLTERELIALAVFSEEDDARRYQDFADACAGSYPASAGFFAAMAAEERAHRDSLLALYRERFGDILPPIRTEEIRGLPRMPAPPPGAVLAQPERMRSEATARERRAETFYAAAAARSRDARLRALFNHLAEAERGHEERAGRLEAEHLTEAARDAESTARHRRIVLTYVQPGLAGLIDGSVSTLAPLFAAAFATQSNKETFLVGLAASVGAGISMGITEAMSDDGIISGRGAPWLRGLVCGLMTMLGGLGHTLPYLVPDSWPNAFHIATLTAALIVAAELVAIAWIRTHYMETPFLRSVFQVVVGGTMVLLAGIFIGSA